MRKNNKQSIGIRGKVAGKIKKNVTQTSISKGKEKDIKKRGDR